MARTVTPSFLVMWAWAVFSLFFLLAMPSSLHLPRPLENTGELVDHLVALGIRQPENDLQCDRYVRDIFLDVTRLLFLVGGAIATADMAIQAAAALLQRQLQLVDDLVVMRHRFLGLGGERHPDAGDVHHHEQG